MITFGKIKIKSSLINSLVLCVLVIFGVAVIGPKKNYLNHSFHPASTCFVATINNMPACFFAVLHQPHNKIKNRWRGHRIIVFPDFQGISISRIVCNFIAKYFMKLNKSLSITTAHPARIISMKNDPLWVFTHFGRIKSHKNLRISSEHRITTSWLYVKEKFL